MSLFKRNKFSTLIPFTNLWEYLGKSTSEGFADRYDELRKKAGLNKSIEQALKGILPEHLKYADNAKKGYEGRDLDVLIEGIGIGFLAAQNFCTCSNDNCEEYVEYGQDECKECRYG